LLLRKYSKNKNWQLIASRIAIQYNGNRYKIAPLSLAFKLNSQITPEKCFDYCMTDFYNNYSKEFEVNDKITSLKESDKIISFIATLKPPWLLLKRHQEKYKNLTDSLKIVIAKE
jgi:hypothetical protein